MNLEELLAACAIGAPEKVELPELGKTVWVRQLSADQGLECSANLPPPDGTGLEHARGRLAALLVAYLCDESGTPILQTLDQARELMRKLPSSLVTRIVNAGLKLNGMDEATTEKN